MSLTANLCRAHRLSIRRTYLQGQRCKSVFEVGTCDGRVLILKVGETPLGVEEIRKNCAGYAAIRELGLGRLIPEISSWSVGEREAFILMEHCGNDFVTESRRLSDPEAMYRQLVDLLRDVYQYSIAMRRRGGGRTVLVAKQRIATLYSQQLGPVLDRQGHHAPLIERVQKVAIEAGPLSCFASWEFAPRNVFLSDGRLKFADPNWVVTGLPIIELAMFAGMAPGFSRPMRTMCREYHVLAARESGAASH